MTGWFTGARWPPGTGMRFALVALLAACGVPSAAPTWPSIVTIAGKNAESCGYHDGVGVDAVFAGLAYDAKRNALSVADRRTTCCGESTSPRWR